MRNDLDRDAVQAALSTRWLGRAYRHVASTGSTNDDLRAWADAPAGAVLLAEYQSAGRGRLGRRWEAPPGSSLLFSALFRPNWPVEQASWLTMIAGLAVVGAIRRTARPDRPLDARLKWPNDVMLVADGQPRKTAGVLLDTSLGGDGALERAIVGIGLNVNLPAEALPDAPTPPTSLLAATGRGQDRLALLAAILGELERLYEAADAGRSPRAAWNVELLTLGQSVTVSPAGGGQPLRGVAETTTEEGYLLVRDGEGFLHTVTAGDVTLRGAPDVDNPAAGR